MEAVGAIFATADNKVTAMTHGEPPGGQTGMADSRQGCRGGRRLRLASLHPCLLAAMGGQRKSREGSLTSCIEP